MLERFRTFLRKPVHAVLPQHDPDFRLRYTLLRHQAMYFETFSKKAGQTFVEMPLFQTITYISREFFPNILLVGSVLIFSVVDYFNDGRVLNSREDIERIVKKFHLIDDFVPITDESCYELNTAFEIMKKITKEKRAQLVDRISHAKYFTVDKRKFIKNFNDTEYYYQECNYINETQTFDVDGLFVPYLSDGKKKLRLNTIILTNKKIESYPTFVFQKTDHQWNVVRSNYINWTRSLASILLHQLGSNVYCPSVLQHMRNSLAETHPITILMKPFFEGVYFTNNVFLSFGISIGNTEQELVNSYMHRVELFDLSNDTMITALKSMHTSEGKYLLNYPLMMKAHKLEDIHFTQKELLEKTYDMVLELVSNVISYYYKSENDYRLDTELADFAIRIAKDYPFVGDIKCRDELIVFLTNIIYLSSIRHSQSHMNFCYLANFYEYALRKTDLDMLLDKLKMEDDPVFPESMLFSTVGDFYSRYSSGVYPSVPVNLFAGNYENHFDDPNVTAYYNEMVQKFITLRDSVPRNQFTEFMYRMEKSNTI